MVSARRAVYTAMIGDYEVLGEQPIARTSDVPFICFTDDPTLRSDTWQIVLVEPRFAADNVRSARRLKVLGSDHLAAYDETLWIDNRIELLVQPEDILDDWLSGSDLALPDHSFRDTVLDEFRAVADGGLDDSGRAYEQLFHYHRTRPRVLEEKPAWTGMMARRSTPAVHATMAYWFEEILRYSRRDQLSFNAALDATATSRRTITLEIPASELHRWRSPQRMRRDDGRNADSIRRALEPPFASHRSMESENLSLRSSVAALTDSVAALTDERDDLLTAADGREREVRDLAAAVAALESREPTIVVRTDPSAQRRVDELLASTSWRVTRPLRALSSAVRRQG